jgi:lactoylglutathione lyase
MTMRIVRSALAAAAAVGFLLAAGIAPARAETKAAETGPIYVNPLIVITNLEKSVDYYTRLIGLKEANRVPLGNGGYEIILTTTGSDWDTGIGLIYQPSRKDALEHGNAYNRMAFFVRSADEVDARVKKIADEGYKIVVPPSTSKAGKRTYRYAHFKDPDGYTVEFTWFDPNAK